MANGARAMAHMVYFTLKEPTPGNREALVNACHKYLIDHPGTIHFSAGVRAEEFDRPVNDRRFDVALHVVFESKDAHDAYQAAPRHQQFIAESKESWAEVRVFDSYI